MGRPEKERGRCRSHPKHQLSVGVCPFCLRERLSRLSTTTSTSAVACLYSTTASSSPCSSDSEVSSSASSPPPRHYDVKKRARVPLLKGDQTAESTAAGLTKSRSLAYVIGRRKKEEEEKEKEDGSEEKMRKRNGKFWSKLLSGSRGRKGGEREEDAGNALMHCKTLKEKASTKWILFS